MVVWESILTVRKVEQRDYGTYQCIARNELGYNTSRIILTGTSTPDTPRSLKVINITHNSVELAWEPSFDGGLQQYYKIRYNVGGKDPNHYLDVYPVNVTQFTVTGLMKNREYRFSILAFNSKGESPYLKDIVNAKTLSKSQIHFLCLEYKLY